MNKIYLLFLLSTSFAFSQLGFCPKCNYESKYKINEKEFLIKSEIIEYKNQIGFKDLDSISQVDFIDKKITMIFDNSNLTKYEETNLLNGIKLHHDSSSFTYENNKLKKIEYLDLMPYSSKARREVFEYKNDTINHFVYDYKFDLYNKKSINTKYKQVTQYFIRNNQVVKQTESSFGVITNKIYKYNDKGDIIYEEIPGLTINTNYTYNSKGNIIKDITTNSSDRKFITTYKYDNENNLIEENFLTVRGNFLTKKRYYYSKGLLMKQTKESQKNSAYNEEINYKYDNQGNWIEKETTNNGIPKKLLVRKLTYKTK